MSETHAIHSSEDAKETKSRIRHTVGKVLVGTAFAAGAVSGAGLTFAAHTVYELRNMEIAVDPLGLERAIDTEPAVDDSTMSLVTNVPSFDEASQEYPFLDGINS